MTIKILVGIAIFLVVNLLLTLLLIHLNGNDGWLRYHRRKNG
jgi:hypothetical protein